MMFRRFRSLAVLAAFFVVAVSASPDVGRAEDSPQAFIENLAQQAMGALTVPNVPRAERIAKFRTLFKEHFAVESIAKWVLGRYWKKATEAEQQEYVALFEDYIIASYVDRFAEYTGESLKIEKTAEEEAGVSIVFSEIQLPESGAKPVRVNWRVERTEGEYRITDVQVEGVSMGATLRSDFGSIVRSNGGKIAALLDLMRKKTKELGTSG